MDINNTKGDSDAHGDWAILRVVPLLVFVAGLLLTGAFWDFTRQQTDEAVSTYFDFRVRQAVSLTRDRIQAQQQVLRGARGLFATSGQVARQDFHDYVLSLKLDENYPGIQGVGFSVIVPPQDLARHTAMVRRDSGHPEYVIHPEGKRELYTSIIYLEPFYGRNLLAFGFDMYSEPVRRAAMEKSRDTDSASLSGKVLLVQETEQDVQAGFLIYLPVYRSGAPRGTVQERRANIIGWVYSLFRMNDLARGIYGEHSEDIDIEIYDGKTVAPESLLYDSNLDHAHKSSTLIVVQSLIVIDHAWTLRISAMPALVNKLDNKKKHVVAYAGVSLSALLAMLAWMLVNGRRRAIAYASEMNRELIENERRLLDSEQKLQGILQASQVAIGFANKAGVIEYLNPKFVSLFGYTLEDIPTVEQWYLHAYPDEEYRARVVADWNARVTLARQKRAAIDTMELDVVCKDGSLRHVLLMGSRAGDNLLAVYSDITERKELEEQVRQMAYYDSLTRLPNRRLLDDRLKLCMAASKRSGRYAALLMLDLDNFKPLNDSYGHLAGDALLVEVAIRLNASVREIDTVARFGGDEFVVVLGELDKDRSQSVAQALDIAEKIRVSLSRDYSLTLRSEDEAERLIVHRCTASIGTVVFIGHEFGRDVLMKCADRAMYQAKEAGRNQVRFVEAKECA